jgi:uncharacterized protein YdaU (DUF1376 family)
MLREPPIAQDCDCRDLDGFMLNVERLMASELVALSSVEIIGAALLLWCRAWKQLPAASLPNDDRVIASFAKLSLPRFKKIKSEVLRGFVECSDGRLYHTVLAVEAANAWKRKKEFRDGQENKQNRQERWRSRVREASDELRERGITPPRGASMETLSRLLNDASVDADETVLRLVGQGQGQGQKQKESPSELRSEPRALASAFCPGRCKSFSGNPTPACSRP